MIEDGKRLEHVKSPNHISEVIDSFNILNSLVNHGPGKPSAQVVILAARMHASLTGETFRQNSENNFSLQADGNDVKMEKVIYANLTCSLDVARQLVEALNKSISDAEKALAAQIGS